MNGARAFGARVVLVAVAAASLSAQTRDQRQAAVGMRAYLEQVVLPGTELIPAPTTSSSPVVVRVVRTWPHGDLLRYDLEWTGFEVGRHDLRRYLVRKDGSPLGELPALEVDVTGVLPPGKDGLQRPEPLPPRPAERLDGYSKLQLWAGIGWGVGLLAILFVGRRFRRRQPPPPPAPTLADRLRPLVQSIAAGGGDTAAKAELERLLVAYWRSRLDLGSATAAAAIATIHRHAEAGALLRQLEAWLHMPGPPAPVDLNALLAPYRNVSAHSFAPPAGETR
ncbi:MAG: hypothetical protein MUC36_00040 [Planctomycetes bacterium]|jgi:hypothetical protein|nr:hypothetical protein [Planctomycetota bacterium]